MSMSNSQAFAAHVHGYIHGRKQAADAAEGFEVLIYFEDASGENEEYVINERVRSWEITCSGPDFIRICIVQEEGGVVDQILPLRRLHDVTMYHPDRDGTPAPEANDQSQVTA